MIISGRLLRRLEGGVRGRVRALSCCVHMPHCLAALFSGAATTAKSWGSGQLWPGQSGG